MWLCPARLTYYPRAGSAGLRLAPSALPAHAGVDRLAAHSSHLIFSSCLPSPRAFVPSALGARLIDTVCQQPAHGPSPFFFLREWLRLPFSLRGPKRVAAFGGTDQGRLLSLVVLALERKVLEGQGVGG